MARAVVIVRRTSKISAEGSSVVEIDSCLEESHSLTNTVTDHPVEEGFNVSDHSRPNPDLVTLRCFVSNTPLSAEQRTRAVRQGDVDFRTSSESGVQIGATDGRGANAYLKLLKLRNEGTLVEVVTTLKTYGTTATEGMMIESLTIPRSKDNFDGLEFSINLKQVRIVKNRRTTDRKQKEKNTRKEKKDGQKTTEKKDTRSQLAKEADGDGLVNKVKGAIGF